MGNGGDAAGSDDYEFDFFISRTKADRGWAEWIAWHLEATEREPGRRFRVLLQDWDFVPGRDWTDRMEEGIRRAERVLPVLSPDYLGSSPFGTAEWRPFWRSDPQGHQRRTIPVRVRECKPDGLLGSIIYIDLIGLKNEDEAASRLLSGIQAALGGRIKPPVKPPWPGHEIGHFRSIAPRAVSTRPDFPGASSDTDRIAGETISESTVTVLHLSGMRLLAQPAAGRTPATLVTWLSDDLRRLATGADSGIDVGAGGPRPDLVVVTGDLTETGTKPEFEQAYDLLAGLADALGLDHDRFAIIPGSHDVSRK
ncbi:TIR domain-containing protein, partial [Frankia sp. CiP1_Cm_nod1]